METVVGLPFTKSWKVLSFRERTWYGPRYGDVSAGRMVSFLRKTWDDVGRSVCTKVVALECQVAAGGCKLAMASRSDLMRSVVSGGVVCGWLLKNIAGIFNTDP